MTPQFNTHFRYRRPLVIGLVIGLLVMAIVGARHYAPERTVARKQAALLEAIEKRSGSRLRTLLARDYLDQWEFDREDAATALLDVGSQFLILAVKPIDSRTEIVRGEATVTAMVRVSGSGGPIAQTVIRRANRLEEPFVFTWRKQGFWPGSWRLERIENPGLPPDLYGYEPGDIRRRLGEL